MHHRTQAEYASDDERWRAVQRRDQRADGLFYVLVRTTGTYSRPSCVARPARRENITFAATAAEACAAGYRPCRRCRPDEPDLNQRYAEAVTRACRVLDDSEQPLSLGDLARMMGYSRFHFHRLFKAFTGITPHAYLEAGRASRVRRELPRADSVADAIYSCGFNSNGHFYAASSDILGMTPTSFRSGGRGSVIRYVVTVCSLGPVLVGATDRGVCAVLADGDASALPGQLARLFPEAEVAEADVQLGWRMVQALRWAELPLAGRRLLPADVQGIALRQRVIQALRGRTAIELEERWAHGQLDLVALPS
jgi:AraC family transcriptional regulator of adaptative response/methylated-DNA-[protein]-cysteine methyltransferase